MTLGVLKYTFDSSKGLLYGLVLLSLKFPPFLQKIWSLTSMIDGYWSRIAHATLSDA